MTKKELRKLSLQFRTLASQMLKIEEQEEINYIRMFYDFISSTPFFSEYISECHTTDYDFVEIYRTKDWHEVLVYPDNPKGVVDFGYQHDFLADIPCLFQIARNQQTVIGIQFHRIAL